MRRPALLVALLVGGGLRLLVFLLADAHPARFVTKDSLQYDEAARRFGATYVHPHGLHSLDLGLLRPPGYPAFIAFVYTVAGRHVTAVIAVQLVISVATIVGVYALAAALLGARAAAAAAFLLAIDPVSIAMSSNLTTETVFAASWVVAALLWVAGLRRRAPWLLAAAGLVFGLSVLIRPIGLYLPVVCLPLTFALVGGRRRQRVVAAAALLVGFAIPVGLWLARNAAESGVVTVSTIEAKNLLDYRAADAVAIDEGGSRPDAARRLDREVARKVPAGANGARVAQVQSSLARHTLLDHPKGAFLTTAHGLGRVLFGPGRAELLRLVRGQTSVSTAGDRAIVAVEAAILLLLLALAGLGCVVLVRARDPLPLAVGLALAAYDILLAAGPEGNARLRMPATPFLALLAGAGATGVARIVSSRAAR